MRRPTGWPGVCSLNRDEIHHLAELWGSTLGRETGEEVWMTCPFARFSHRSGVDRKAGNFSVRISDTGNSVCYCFACGSGGHVVVAARQLAKEDTFFKKALNYVKKVETGMFLPADVQAKKKMQEAKADSDLWQALRSSKARISKVLRERGISRRDELKWKLGHDADRHRDLFPVFDYKRRLIGISGRAISDDQFPKYLHYGEEPENLTKVFYGEQFLDPTVPEAILVEGPTDTIKNSRYYPNVLGIMGAQIMTPERIERLKRWFETITLYFDGDASGRQGMFKIGLTLFESFTLFVAFLPEGVDPFDATDDQRMEAMKNRVLWSLVDWGERIGGSPSAA
jgi:DNA primase